MKKKQNIRDQKKVDENTPHISVVLLHVEGTWHALV